MNDEKLYKPYEKLYKPKVQCFACYDCGIINKNTKVAESCPACEKGKTVKHIKKVRGLVMEWGESPVTVNLQEQLSNRKLHNQTTKKEVSDEHLHQIPESRVQEV